MDYRFAGRMAQLKASAIREILKYSADPDVIAFSAGNPAPEAFPVEAIKEIAAGILQNHPVEALQYSLTEGYAPLRETVKADLKDRLATGTDSDEVLITTGANQGIDLACKAFCDEGDVIICEAPSFIGSINAFKTYQPTLIGIPMEDDGMDIGALESALKENPNAKLIYVIPNFQNPSGVTTSFEKRRAIYRLAQKYNVMILEDNPYGELRFEGEDIPAVKTLDTDGRVIYCGSFSKVLSPGLRVGYLLANAQVIQKIVVLKQTNDVHTTILSQMICHEFITKYDFKAHLLSLKDIYRHKCGLMISGIQKNFSSKVKHTSPQGGLFVWCTLPKGADMMSFCTDAVKDYKVAVVPGTAFMIHETDETTSFRMNFSTPTDERIVKGTEILGRMTKERFGE